MPRRRAGVVVKSGDIVDINGLDGSVGVSGGNVNSKRIYGAGSEAGQLVARVFPGKQNNCSAISREVSVA